MASVTAGSDIEGIFSDIAKRNLWYERIPFTNGPFTLNSGSNTIFNATSLSPEDPEWMTMVESPAVTNTYPLSYITINGDRIQYGGNTATGSLAAFRAGLRGDPQARVQAINDLSVFLYGDAQHTGFQFNCYISRLHLTLAEKLVLGGTVASLLTPDELSASNYGAGTDKAINVAVNVAKGTAPIPLHTQIARTFEPMLRGVQPVWLYAPAVGTTDTPMGTDIVPYDSDDLLVLREIGVEEDPSTSAAPNAAVAFTVDTYTNYFGINGNALSDAVVGGDDPLDVWVPANQKVSVSSQAFASTANVAVRLVVWHLRKSAIIRARMGQKNRVPERTFLQVIGGVA